ncbi:hypothetical protein GT348_01700 [Aristophania vespae]|uniref:FAD-dependent urate hydroxylase HpyO/Asp monooxygenase CreE-like FAD/NAD(P)-binding domain-containing protein n=1 Tax=Aristophania vespae TaxID=2697033 RepID=A0A6P1NCB1_9PROT|nr:hypothetical protein GT348_01700 [Aristophania vespae]
MKIALIGGGPAAIITALHLCERQSHQDSAQNFVIDIYEPSQSMRGNLLKAASLTCFSTQLLNSLLLIPIIRRNF